MVQSWGGGELGTTVPHLLDVCTLFMTIILKTEWDLRVTGAMRKFSERLFNNYQRDWVKLSSEGGGEGNFLV